MDDDVTIRLATSTEVADLPSMQVAAGNLFREIDMAQVADGPEPEVAGFAQAQQAGHLLVALVEAKVVGFALVEVLDAALHVEQVTVAPA